MAGLLMLLALNQFNIRADKGCGADGYLLTLVQHNVLLVSQV